MENQFVWLSLAVLLMAGCTDRQIQQEPSPQQVAECSEWNKIPPVDEEHEEFSINMSGDPHALIAGRNYTLTVNYAGAKPPSQAVYATSYVVYPNSAIDGNLLMRRIVGGQRGIHSNTTFTIEIPDYWPAGNATLGLSQEMYHVYYTNGVEQSCGYRSNGYLSVPLTILSSGKNYSVLFGGDVQAQYDEKDDPHVLVTSLGNITTSRNSNWSTPISLTLQNGTVANFTLPMYSDRRFIVNGTEYVLMNTWAGWFASSKYTSHLVLLRKEANVSHS